MLKEATLTWPRIEPGSPDPEPDSLTTRPVRSLLYEVRNCFGRALSVVDKIGYYTATLNEKQGLYKEGSNVNMRTQGNYYELNESYRIDVPRFVKQRSDKWFEL